MSDECRHRQMAKTKYDLGWICMDQPRCHFRLWPTEKVQHDILIEMADRTIAETVCCDEYERFAETGERPQYPHHICYWGSAHAEALRERAAELWTAP